MQYYYGFSQPWNAAVKLPFVLRILTFPGIDVNAMDKQGLTPLMWAAAHRQVNLLDSGIDFCDVEKYRYRKKYR